MSDMTWTCWDEQCGAEDNAKQVEAPTGSDAAVAFAEGEFSRIRPFYMMLVNVRYPNGNVHQWAVYVEAVPNFTARLVRP
jgi:hypothetical protein